MAPGFRTRGLLLHEAGAGRRVQQQGHRRCPAPATWSSGPLRQAVRSTRTTHSSSGGAHACTAPGPDPSPGPATSKSMICSGLRAVAGVRRLSLARPSDARDGGAPWPGRACPGLLFPLDEERCDGLTHCVGGTRRNEVSDGSARPCFDSCQRRLSQHPQPCSAASRRAVHSSGAYSLIRWPSSWAGFVASAASGRRGRGFLSFPGDLPGRSERAAHATRPLLFAALVPPTAARPLPTASASTCTGARARRVSAYRPQGSASPRSRLACGTYVPAGTKYIPVELVYIKVHPIPPDTNPPTPPPPRGRPRVTDRSGRAGAAAVDRRSRARNPTRSRPAGHGIRAERRARGGWASGMAALRSSCSAPRARTASTFAIIMPRTVLEPWFSSSSPGCGLWGCHTHTSYLLDGLCARGGRRGHRRIGLSGLLWWYALSFLSKPPQSPDTPRSRTGSGTIAPLNSAPRSSWPRPLLRWRSTCSGALGGQCLTASMLAFLVAVVGTVSSTRRRRAA